MVVLKVSPAQDPVERARGDGSLQPAEQLALELGPAPGVAEGESVIKL
jgi:hypothetical protein